MAAPARTDADVVEGTIVFTDLVGFTEFTASRGDAEALQLLSTQDRLVRSVLPGTARIVKELGDGLFLWFPEPDSALRCALELHRILENEAATTGLPLWIRVGMHHGHGPPARRRPRRQRRQRRGEDRRCRRARRGARLRCRARRSPAPTSQVGFEELGPVVMKGIPAPIRLWRATNG